MVMPNLTIFDWVIGRVVCWPRPKLSVLLSYLASGAGAATWLGASSLGALAR